MQKNNYIILIIQKMSLILPIEFTLTKSKTVKKTEYKRIMKKLFAISIMLVSLISFAQNETFIVHEGHYQGKNLYVQNPFAGSGVGFCVIKVSVNGDATTDQISSSAFEIDFANLNLKQGDPVVVKIAHKTDCQPKVLNPEVLRPKSTFATTSIKVESGNLLKWCTTGESGKLTYLVEQYRWNKWIKVGEVDGIGTDAANCYEFQVELHSGTNKFRVKQIDYSGKPNISQSTSIESDNPKLKLIAERGSDVEFTGETLYEIYDTYGNMVKKGYGKLIDCGNLEKGLYYVNYDNTTGDVWNKNRN
ncbi:MAG: hypothetical protein ACI8Q1_000012 [Parvicella sp.]|jgi:hypothetical protein